MAPLQAPRDARCLACAISQQTFSRYWAVSRKPSRDRKPFSNPSSCSSQTVQVLKPSCVWARAVSPFQQQPQWYHRRRRCRRRGLRPPRAFFCMPTCVASASACSLYCETSRTKEALSTVPNGASAEPLEYLGPAGEPLAAATAASVRPPPPPLLAVSPQPPRALCVLQASLCFLCSALFGDLLLIRISLFLAYS